jgi:hypothetical protein
VTAQGAGEANPRRHGAGFVAARRRVIPCHGHGERRGIGDACAQIRFFSFSGKREKASKRERSTRGFLQAAPLTPPKLGGALRFDYPKLVWSGSSITAVWSLTLPPLSFRILLDSAYNVFQVWEFLRGLTVQTLDNLASPFTVYAQKLVGTGFGSQYVEWYSPIIMAQVSDFNSLSGTT